jgi:hypothetical protein
VTRQECLVVQSSLMAADFSALRDSGATRQRPAKVSVPD